MKSALITFVISLAFFEFAGASSFVGNGGSPGDVELTVAKKQIQATLDDIKTWEPDENPCVCGPNFARTTMCEYLKDLTDAQVKTCSSFIREKGDELKALYQRDEIAIGWTHEKITVIEGGRRRAVDAVADPKEGRLTLDQRRFLEMDAADRVFLLAHEGLHFIKWKGKSLVDEGPFESFPGDEGGRRFINSVAAAVAVGAYESRQIAGYSNVLSRSKSYKTRWLDLSSGGDESRRFDLELRRRAPERTNLWFSLRLR